MDDASPGVVVRDRDDERHGAYDKEECQLTTPMSDFKSVQERHKRASSSGGESSLMGKEAARVATDLFIVRAARGGHLSATYTSLSRGNCGQGVALDLLAQPFSHV